jgi:hypothetical protein
VCFIPGCSSVKVASPPAASAKSAPPALQPPDKSSAPPTLQFPDESWPVGDYLRIGMPDPDRLWTAADYRDCRDILYKLERTQRTALPRLESAKSGPLFARFVNPTNTLLLADRFLPTEERIRSFVAILNRLPAFQEIYRFALREPAFHRESIELDHTLLRMLGHAVEWDDKSLPPSAGETRGATFRLVELSRTSVESLLNLSPAQSVVPRGDRFIVVGAYSVVTLRSRLAWLADGTGLPEAERLRAIRYLREDMPILWPHLSASQQHESVGDLDEVLRRTRNEHIRRELEAFRQQLVPR